MIVVNYHADMLTDVLICCGAIQLTFNTGHGMPQRFRRMVVLPFT
jgi:hypothetical protein